MAVAGYDTHCRILYYLTIVHVVRGGTLCNIHRRQMAVNGIALRILYYKPANGPNDTIVNTGSCVKHFSCSRDSDECEYITTSHGSEAEQTNGQKHVTDCFASL